MMHKFEKFEFTRGRLKKNESEKGINRKNDYEEHENLCQKRVLGHEELYS